MGQRSPSGPKPSRRRRGSQDSQKGTVDTEEGQQERVFLYTVQSSKRKTGQEHGVCTVHCTYCLAGVSYCIYGLIFFPLRKSQQYLGVFSTALGRRKPTSCLLLRSCRATLSETSWEDSKCAGEDGALQAKSSAQRRRLLIRAAPRIALQSNRAHTIP
jgi:ferredoxin